MQQGGYVSQSSGSKQLTVTKKSNVLDKGNRNKSSSATNNGNGADNSGGGSGGGGGGGGSGVSVSGLNMELFGWLQYLIELCFFQESELKEALDEMRKTNEENSKIKDEIRKLKAVIVKHENRIRALEAEKEERDSSTAAAAADSNNNGGDSSQMAPDEV